MAVVQEKNIDHVKAIVLFRLQQQCQSWRLLSHERDEFVRAHRRLEETQDRHAIEAACEAVAARWPHLGG